MTSLTYNPEKKYQLMTAPIFLYRNDRYRIEKKNEYVILSFPFCCVYTIIMNNNRKGEIIVHSFRPSGKKDIRNKFDTLFYENLF